MQCSPKHLVIVDVTGHLAFTLACLSRAKRLDFVKKGSLIHYVLVATGLKTKAKQSKYLGKTFASDAIFRSSGIFLLQFLALHPCQKCPYFITFTFFVHSFYFYYLHFMFLLFTAINTGCRCSISFYSFLFVSPFARPIRDGLILSVVTCQLLAL